MISESRAYKYAVRCAENQDRKVGIYVQRQCLQWLEIVNDKNPKAYISHSQWKKITKILKIIVHPDLNCSMHDGLEDYAMLFIYAIFCTKNAKDSYSTLLALSAGSSSIPRLSMSRSVPSSFRLLQARADKAVNRDEDCRCNR